MALSVQTSHHLILAHRCQVVNIKTLAGQD